MSLSVTTVLPIITSALIASGSLIGVYLSKKAGWRAQGETIRHCYGFLYDKDFMQARYFVATTKDLKKVIDFKKVEYTEERKKLLLVVTTFQLWGFLVKEKYLPLSLFINSDIGQKVIIYYEKTKCYIDFRRKECVTPNPHYAKEFEQLYNDIKKANEKSRQKSFLEFLRHRLRKVPKTVVEHNM